MPRASKILKTLELCFGNYQCIQKNNVLRSTPVPCANHSNFQKALRISLRLEDTIPTHKQCMFYGPGKLWVAYMFPHAKSVSLCRSCKRCASGYALGIISAFRKHALFKHMGISNHLHYGKRCMKGDC